MHALTFFHSHHIATSLFLTCFHRRVNFFPVWTESPVFQKLIFIMNKDFSETAIYWKNDKTIFSDGVCSH